MTLQRYDPELPPQSGGIFLSAHEKERTQQLVDTFPIMATKASRAHELLEHSSMTSETGQQKIRDLRALYVQSRTAEHSERRLAMFSTLATAYALNGDETLDGEKYHSALMFINKKYNGSDIVSPQRQEVMGFIAVLCVFGAMPKFATPTPEPLHPLIEFGVAFREQLVETANRLQDATGLCRQTVEMYQQRLIAEAVRRDDTSDIVVGSRVYEVTQHPTDATLYLVTQDVDSGMSIHFTDAALPRIKDNYRHASTSDNLDFLIAVLDSS